VGGTARNRGELVRISGGEEEEEEASRAEEAAEEKVFESGAPTCASAFLLE
jgi:hypothetical protein